MPSTAEEIFDARNRALTQLSELHNDYFLTNQLWLKLLAEQRRGIAFSAQNTKTGAVTVDPSEWLERVRASQQRLRVRTFKDFTTRLELFLKEILTIWLKCFPESIHAKAITLSLLLSAPDLASARQRAIEEAVESKVSELLHEKPKRWFSYLKQNLGCNVSTSDSEAFIERKAARDTLEHHDGEVDKAYIEKAGTAAIYKLDEKIDPDDTIIDALYDLVKKLVENVSNDAKFKIEQIETKTKAE